nr:primase homolog protein isoform X2 [Lolium perenne]
MPPRPSLRSLLLIAASPSVAAGDSGLLLAARRHFPAALAAAGGHRIRLLHSFSGGRLPRPVELACCFGTAPAAVPVVPRSRNVGSIDKMRACEERIGQLVAKLEDKGIRIKQWRIGAFNRTLCPVCKGGFNKEQSLSVFIRNDGLNARWTCFRANCGWKGNAQPDGDSNVYQEKKDTGNGSDAGKETVQQFKANHAVKVYRKLCEEDLRLEPLCDELVTYFSERMISPETLRRNNVSQRKWNDKIVIAFTYRRDKVLVGCKYREISKKYTQERNTEKILYGLDDIKQARVVIIVEGEIDKLSMEEAGYRNCVSVPDGAPPQVSNKLPDKDHDTKYRYLWNCKGYLDSASKIILATDADPPGQALAEELARRLGNERCWRVTWPRKNETEFCKDANEAVPDKIFFRDKYEGVIFKRICVGD